MRTLLVLSAFVMLATPALARESGIQITHQGPTVILIQKDVGDERWAITMSLEDTSPLEITGNIFRENGSPAFVQCRPIDVIGDGDIRDKTLVFNCYAADTCPAAPCTADQWSFVAEVSLPGSFFVP